jgi:replication factor C small subunit
MIWTEKYRPKSLLDIVGQEDVVEEVRSYVKRGDLPHLIFIGPSGVGKSTTAYCIARELFGNDIMDFKELNASDERGINTIRETVMRFCRVKAWNGTGFRILFLDEADSLTHDAQQCLRRPMERYAHNVRFLLSGNEDRFHEAIKSRCKVLKFRSIPEDAIVSRLREICSHENANVPNHILQSMAKRSNGDMRKAILDLRGVLR